MHNELTVKDIAFIDLWLESIGVEYIDIRYEMTDHIASEMENRKGDFYDNLRDYMALNKNRQMEQNKYFSGLAAKKAMGMLLKTFIRPVVFLVFVVLLLIVNVLLAKYSNSVENVLLYTNLTLIVVFSAYIKIYKQKFKFSGPEKLMRYASSMHFAFLFLMIAIQELETDNAMVNMEIRFLSSFFISLIILVLFTFTGYQKKLKRQFIQ